MSSVQVSCPSCGAAVTFTISSALVVVCEFCRSVVGRGDRQPEDYGKIAVLVGTASPLRVGLTGSYKSQPFTLTGRAQFAHQAGGVWDEWYAAFPNDRWGWLAEAQGRFYLTFQRDLLSRESLIPADDLVLGEWVPDMPSLSLYRVAEKGVAQTAGAEGEIPYTLIPGETHVYADLSGPHGAFATLDYNQEPPLLFLGHEVTLTELGWAHLGQGTASTPKQATAVQLACPHCGGPLALRAPDKTERVTCPNCGSLLDVNHGQLKYLTTLTLKVTPLIPLGAVGTFNGQQFTTIGFLRRSVTFDGLPYHWDEYLLYQPLLGFRWLVHSDHHWNFVEPVPVGMVESAERTAQFRQRTFKLYQDASARVEHVLGECYWKVEVGETVQTADYVHPPLMLSKEQNESEINWSLGTYMPPAEVARIFALTDIPQPQKVAPNQPYPHSQLFAYWGWLLLAGLALGLLLFISASSRRVMNQIYQLEPAKIAEDSAVYFSEPFAVRARENIRITADAPIANTWVEIDGDIINQATDESVGFTLPIEYYHGVEDGERWSEGGQRGSTYLSALPAGTYVLGLDIHREHWQQPLTLSVTVEQGVPRFLHFVGTLFLLSLIPLLMAFHYASFNQNRWEDSEYSPFNSAESDDSDD